jgi:predicted GNAT family N-acyltransferase
MYEIRRFNTGDEVLTAMARALRHAVFVEEQGVDPALEYENEEESHHYLLLLAGKAVATARWRETEKGIKLERFAVLAAFRNRGLGEIILHEVLQDTGLTGKPIYLHAQLRAVPFYQRNGFYKVGEPFTEAGIQHFLMKYTE